MRRTLTWLAAAGIAFAAIYFSAGQVQATRASGFTGTTIAVGRLAEFEVENHLKTAGDGRDDEWESEQKTEGASDLYVQSNVWVAGGSTGWHSHPGHSLIVVTEGTLTVYEASDPGCAGRTYQKGDAFVDPGGDHVHLIRNEGGVNAATMAVQLIPAGATRRIDAGLPPNCTVQ